MRMYRIWAGNPKGNKENPTKCVVSVADGGRSVLSHQCRNKRGFGPNGLYCRRHAKMIEEGRYIYVPEDGAGAGDSI